MQFQSFDAEYVERLKTGDAAIEDHFASYFGTLLSIKLRARLHSRQVIEDLRQETLLRVLQTLRKKNGVAHPERFGAFVNAVCNNVIMEFFRRECRDDPGNRGKDEPPDTTVDLDAALVNSDTKRLVRRVLDELSSKDRRLLHAVYLEELDKSEVCRRYGVDADYLRVLLHRAKLRFRKAYQAQGGTLGRRPRHRSR